MATAWLGAVPPPLGIVPNFEDPPSQLTGNIALHTVCLTLATLSVAVRLCTRMTITKSKLGIDDCLCTFSYACSITFSGLMIKSYTWGIGRHMWDTPAIWIPSALKYFTIAQYIFQILSCAIKLTFLCLYYRIFSIQPHVKYFISFGIVFVLFSNAALLFATIFACTPVARAWNPMLPGHCINAKILPYLSGSLNLATDLYILFLPMISLWRLNLGVGRRTKMIAIFSLGVFACIACLIRLIETPVLHSSADATWNISKIAVWAVIEVNVGIICSSSTLLPAFFDRHWPKAINDSIARLWSNTRGQNTSTDRSSKTPSQYGSKHTKAKDWAPHEFVGLNNGEGLTVIIQGNANRKHNV